MNQHNEELSYKIYMTDCAAAMARAEKRWYDLLTASTETEQPDIRSADVDEMINNNLSCCGVTITEEVKT